MGVETKTRGNIQFAEFSNGTVAKCLVCGKTHTDASKIRAVYQAVCCCNGDGSV